MKGSNDQDFRNCFRIRQNYQKKKNYSLILYKGWRTWFSERSPHITSPVFSDSSLSIIMDASKESHSGVFRMQVAACTASKLAWHTNKKTMTRAVGVGASNSSPDEVQNEISPPHSPPPWSLNCARQLRFDFLRSYAAANGYFVVAMRAIA